MADFPQEGHLVSRKESFVAHVRGVAFFCLLFVISFFLGFLCCLLLSRLCSVNHCVRGISRLFRLGLPIHALLWRLFVCDLLQQRGDGKNNKTASEKHFHRFANGRLKHFSWIFFLDRAIFPFMETVVRLCEAWTRLQWTFFSDVIKKCSDYLNFISDQQWAWGLSLIKLYACLCERGSFRASWGTNLKLFVRWLWI